MLDTIKNSKPTDLNSYWPKLLSKISENSDVEYCDIYQSITWLRRVLVDNVPYGKQVRANVFLELFRSLKKKRTAEEDEISFVVAWCIEIMQTSYLFADDIMDLSETRRGRPCWYKQPDVGLMAINDTLLLENFVYQLLIESVKESGKLLELIKLFQKTSYRTILGQSLDTKMGMEKNYEKFTFETYSAIVKYKTSYYTFYQPAAAALMLAGVGDDEVLSKIENISILLGHLFQVQDDYIDCYSNPEHSGKIGTDILDAKCSWLAVTALSTASKDQRDIFEQNYGVRDKISEDKIKELYAKLNIPAKFEIFQQKLYDEIKGAIAELPKAVAKGPFFRLLNLIYKRDK